MQPFGILWRAALASVVAALCFLPGAPVGAQQTRAPAPIAPSSRDIPRPDQLEPGVNTTPTEAPAEPAPAAPAVSDSARETPPAAAAGPAAANSQRTGASQGASAAQPAGAPPKDAAAEKAAGHKAGADRLQLDTTDITGNRELPKVLYIVPWKHAELGDLVGKPVNSLLDEVLQPLDRDVFRRENRYYDALQPGGNATKAGAVQGSENKP